MAYSTPAATFYKDILKATSSGTSGGLLKQLGGSIAPTLGLDQLQSAVVQQEMGMVGTQLNLSNAYQKMLAKYTTAQLDITGTKLKITTTGLQEQRAYLTKTFQLQSQQLGLQQQLLNEQSGLEQKQYTVTSEKYATEVKTANIKFRTQVLGQESSIAGSGVQGTTAQRAALTTIVQQHTMALKTITRSMQLATLKQQTALAKQAYTRAMLGISGQQLTAKYKYTMQQLQNAQANLSLLAKSNGLSEQEVLTRLNYSLSQNQLSAAQTLVGMLTKLGSIWTGEETTVGNAIGQAGLVTGVNLYAPAASNSSSSTTKAASKTKSSKTKSSKTAPQQTTAAELKMHRSPTI